MAEINEAQRRSAFEAARRAQEAARRAAAEREALLEVQRHKGLDEGISGNFISREVFVEHGSVGTREQREAAFDRLNTDGQAGLSTDELETFFEEQGALPAPPVSDGVQDAINDALEDDRNTGGDFLEAIGEVRTAADIDAVMAAAQATGQNREAVLRMLVRSLDEQAEPPQTDLYNRLADHFDQLPLGGRAADTLRAIGDPAVSRDVRRELTHAVQDDDDTAEDRLDAARAVRSPADLAAVLAFTPGDPRSDLLHEVRRGIDTEAEGANTALLNALGDAFEANDQGRAAARMREAADPRTDDATRRELLNIS